MRTCPLSPRLYISAAKGFLGLCELTDMPRLSPESAHHAYTRVRVITFTSSSDNKVKVNIAGPLYYRICEKQPKEDWPTREPYSQPRAASLQSTIGRPMEHSDELLQDSMCAKASRVLGVITIEQLISKSTTCIDEDSEHLSWIRATDPSSVEKNSR